MNKTALIVAGGWDGHHPAAVADLFAGVLAQDGFDVRVEGSLSAFDDPAALAELDLIVPHWTMGTLSPEQCKAVTDAVAGGVGLAGCHGGMGDAFRDNTEWHWMTGGQFVAHPGNDGTPYRVRIGPAASPITAGIADFSVASEQYYMHVDPVVTVLATTGFPVADGPHAVNGPVDVPVIWTKRFGRGRVFYNSLGHDPDVLKAEPCLTLMRRGFAWAASENHDSKSPENSDQ